MTAAADRWRTVVSSNNALFDGIECMYCETVLDAKKRRRRLEWCKIQSEGESYYQAARQLNFNHFGSPLAPFNSENVKKEHERSDTHRKNVQQYNKTSDNLKSDVCKTMAHLECSILMMQKVIRVSQKREESHLWYLGLCEESYSLKVELEPLFYSIKNTAMFWPIRRA